jgi:hypothetical protein
MSVASKVCSLLFKIQQRASSGARLAVNQEIDGALHEL